MVNTFKTQLDDDLPVFFDTDAFGETITYKGASITAVIALKHGQAIQDTGVKLADAVIWVKAADVAAPERGDAVTIDGASYVVDSILTGDDQVFELALDRSFS